MYCQSLKKKQTKISITYLDLGYVVLPSTKSSVYRPRGRRKPGHTRGVRTIQPDLTWITVSECEQETA